MMRQSRTSRQVAILRVSIVLGFLLQSSLFAYYLCRTMILSPFWDMIAWIGTYIDFSHHGNVFDYLWSPHNEHHLVLIRIITALDIQAFDARGVAFVAAGAGALAVTSLLVWSELRRDQSFRTAAHPLALLGPMLLLTTPAAVDCGIPINTVYPIPLAFLVSAIILFDTGMEPPHWAAARRVAALVAAVLSSWGNAVGLVAWPVLLWLAWRGGASRLWRLLIVSIGIGYVLVYGRDLPLSDLGHTAHLLAPRHLERISVYLVTFLGLPFSRAPGLVMPARLLGGFLLAAGLFAVGRDAFNAAPMTRLHRIAIALILAALAASLLAAVGRVDLEAEIKVPVRYTLWVAPLHIGLLALAMPWLAGSAVTPRRQMSLLASGALLSVVLVMVQIVSGQSAVRAADAIVSTINRYDAGVREPGMDRIIFPDLATADHILAELRRIEEPTH